MAKNKNDEFSVWIRENIKEEDKQAKVIKTFKNIQFFKKQKEKKITKLFNKIALLKDEEEKLLAFWQELKRPKKKLKQKKIDQKLVQFLQKRKIFGFANEEIIKKFETHDNLIGINEKNLNQFFEKLCFNIGQRERQNDLKNVLRLKNELLSSLIKTKQNKNLKNKDGNSEFFERLRRINIANKNRLNLIIKHFKMFQSRLDLIKKKQQEIIESRRIKKEASKNQKIYISLKTIEKGFFEPMLKINKFYFKNYFIVFKLFNCFNIKILKEGIQKEITNIQEDINKFGQNINDYFKIKEKILKSKILNIYQLKEFFEPKIQLKKVLSYLELDFSFIRKQMTFEIFFQNKSDVENFIDLISESHDKLDLLDKNCDYKYNPMLSDLDFEKCVVFEESTPKQVIPSLHCVWIFFDQIGEFKLKETSYTLADYVISDLVVLLKVFQENANELNIQETVYLSNDRQKLISNKNNIANFFKKFEIKYNEFEDKYGFLFDVNNGYFGGLYLVIASINNIEPKNFLLVQKLMRIKIYLKSLLYFIEPRNHFHELRLPSKSMRELYERIELKYFMTTKQNTFIPYSRFNSRLKLSTNVFKVLGQNQEVEKLMYIADILLNEGNLKKFKEKGISVFDVLELRETMWDLFEKKNKFQIQKRDDLISRDNHFILLNQFIKNTEKVMKYIFNDFENENKFGFNKIKNTFDNILKNFKNKLLIFFENRKVKLETIYILIKKSQSILLFCKEKNSQNNAKLEIIQTVLKIIIVHFFSVLNDDPLVLALFQKQKSLEDQQKSMNIIKKIKEKNECETMYSSLIKHYESMIFFLESKNTGFQIEKIDLRKIMNQYLEKLVDYIPIESVENLVNVLCISYFFDVNFYPLKITKNTESVDLLKIKFFYDFLKRKFDYLFFRLNTIVDSQKFERVFINLISKLFQKFLYDKKYKTRFRKLLSYLVVSCHYQFSDEFILKHMLQKRDKKKQKTLSKVIYITNDLSGKKEIPTDLSSNFWNSKENKTDDVKKVAIDICYGKYIIKFEDLLSTNLEIIKAENAHKELTWRYVLQLILSRQTSRLFSIKNINFEYKIAEYIISIYLLCDARCKRIIAKCLADMKIPIPLFYFVDMGAHSYFLPLSEINLKLMKNNGDTVQINPYFYPSVKFTFFTESLEDLPVQSLARDLFNFDGQSLYSFDDSNLYDWGNNTLTSFACKNDTGNKVDCFELSMIIVNNFEVLRFEEKDPYNEFMLNISNVFIIRRCLDSELPWFDNFYQLLKKKNKTSHLSDHIFLIDLVQTNGEETLKLESHFYWHKIVIIRKDDSGISQKISKIINFQKTNLQLGQNAKSLDSFFDGDQQKIYSKQNIDFCLDLHCDRIGPLIYKAKKILQEFQISNSAKIKTLSSFFKLQSKFLSKHINSEKEKNVLKMSKYNKTKHQYYINFLENLRQEELNFIYSIRKDSVVFKLIKSLNGETPDGQIEILSYFEKLLAHIKIKGVFKHDQEMSLQKVNFFREVQHIYEVIFYFLEKFPEKTKRLQKANKNLSILPQTMAYLFLKKHPLEILNGEYLTVSDIWLKAVFGQLGKVHKLALSTPRVCVISIMGLQSSGKSTFLNSLFRLGLSTKDDKCTRGSNAILLEVNKSESKGSKLIIPDFVILVDTEGLGSLENLRSSLSKNSNGSEFKDSKMILFNLGISNHCIMNSMKEFNKKVQKMVNSMKTWEETLRLRSIDLEVDFVFQGVNSNGQKVLEIQESLMNTFTKKGQDLKKVFFFPMIVNKKYSEEYEKAIQEYLEYLFSSEGVCNGTKTVTFDFLGEMIGKMGRMMRLPNFMFDAKQMKSREIRVRKKEFELFLIMEMKDLVFKHISELALKDLKRLLTMKDEQEKVFKSVFKTPKNQIRKEECKKQYFRELEKSFKIKIEGEILEAFKHILEEINVSLFQKKEMYRANLLQFKPKSALKILKDFQNISVKNSDQIDLNQDEDHLFFQIGLEIFEWKPTKHMDEFYREALDANFISQKSSVQDFESQTFELYQHKIRSWTKTKIKKISSSNLNKNKEYLKKLEEKVLILSLEYEKLFTRLNLEEDFSKALLKNFRIRDLDVFFDKLFINFKKIQAEFYRKKLELYGAISQKIKKAIVKEEFLKIELPHKCDSQNTFAKRILTMLKDKKQRDKFELEIFLADNNGKNQYTFMYRKYKENLIKTLNTFKGRSFFSVDCKEDVECVFVDFSLKTIFDIINKFEKEIEIFLEKIEVETKNQRQPIKEKICKRAFKNLFFFLEEKIEEEKRLLLEKIKLSIFKEKKAHFNVNYFDFKNLSSKELINSIISSSMWRGFTNTEIWENTTKKLNILTLKNARKKMAKFTDPFNHLRAIEIQFLINSKNLVKENKMAFIQKLFSFLNNVKLKINEEVKLALQGPIDPKQSKSVYKKEINKIIEKKIKVFSESRDRNNISKDCLPIKFQSKLKDALNKIHLTLGTEEKSLEEKPMGLFLRLFNRGMIHFLKKSKDDFLDEITEKYGEVMELNSEFLAEKYEHLLMKEGVCDQVCQDCFGVCLLPLNHKGSHSFYHIPDFFSGKDPLFCLRSFISPKIKKENPKGIASLLFWTWIIIHYEKEIADYMGFNMPLIYLEGLTLELKKIKIMSEDELIEKL